MQADIKITQGHPFGNTNPDHQLFHLHVEGREYGWFVTEAEARWYAGMIVNGH